MNKISYVLVATILSFPIRCSFNFPRKNFEKDRQQQLNKTLCLRHRKRTVI